jgi:[ribosomal protein S5]-alanine N-acetyltransferase
MPSRSTGPTTTRRRNGYRVHLRPPRKSDATEFVAAVRASRMLHRGLVQPPTDRNGFHRYVTRFAGPKSRNPLSARHAGFLVRRNDDDTLIGVFNLGEIVRGSFQSAYVGYYGFAPYSGEGYMRDGLRLLLDLAFRTFKLHRVEANIQPNNARSIALVRYVGFSREGFSRRYMKVAGRWRDHERWAMLVEDWRAQAATR